MRKIIYSLLFVALAGPASAEEVFQCVNPDVMNGLVFRGEVDSKLLVRRAMPEVTSGFRAPAQFTLIGSGVRGQNRSTTVAYKTTEQLDQALANLLAVASADGWKKQVASDVRPSVFADSGLHILTAGLCRNGERRSVMVQDIGDIRYATISAYSFIPLLPCDSPPAQPVPEDPMASMNALRASMPQFSFPGTARMSADPGTGNSFGGDGMASTSVRLESTDTARSLVSYLGRELVTQGWRNDAEWKGALSSGSTWTRQGSDAQAYAGTLEVLSIASGVYEVGFLLTKGL